MNGDGSLAYDLSVDIDPPVTVRFVDEDISYVVIGDQELATRDVTRTGPGGAFGVSA
jgi:hypothetical protein